MPGAECGTYTVFENRTTRTGRTIGLKVVVLRARGPERRSDAVFFLAGGPGEGATGQAGGMADEFKKLLQHHDFVFVDQRGTGGSHQLPCRLFDPKDPQSALGDFFPPEAIRTCRSVLEKDADLTQYTTPIAMADLDEVRGALGYDRINLVGGSYGTRAALVYLREHGDRARTALLMGVLPTSEPVPAHIARDSQQALDNVLADCAAELACGRAFPDLRGEVQAVLEKLEKGPAEARILEPTSGEPRTVHLSRDLVDEALRYLMYNSGTAGLIPALVHEAARDDFDPLAEFALFGRLQIVGSLGTGLYLCITCAEDVPFVDPAVAEEEAKGTFLGDYRLVQQRRACALWPRAAIPSSYLSPVASNVPVLLLSGQMDPVTPPSNGAGAVRTLPRGLHLVVPHSGHSAQGLEGADCLDRLATEFIEHGTAEKLDTSCVSGIKRRPFALRPPETRIVPLTRQELEPLVGRYVAEGAPFEARIALEGTGLRAELSDGTKLLLAPTAPNRFRVVGELGTFVVFELTDSAGRWLRVEQNGETALELKGAVN
jgi:pimeloyl-ACP methyl ester carboxylesterase